MRFLKRIKSVNRTETFIHAFTNGPGADKWRSYKGGGWDDLLAGIRSGLGRFGCEDRGALNNCSRLKT